MMNNPPSPGSALNRFIDFTYLGKDKDALLGFLSQSEGLELASLCIQPIFLPLAREQVQHRLTTVINFPSGEHALDLVEKEIRVTCLAEEIDVVFPYQTYLSGKRALALQTFEHIFTMLPNNKVIKVIVESGMFTNPEQLSQLCEALIAYDIDFLKTSTGKVAIGATLSHAETMLKVLKSTSIGIKVSGGIKDKETALSFYRLAQQYLSDDDTPALTPQQFRIGSSRLFETI